MTIILYETPPSPPCRAVKTTAEHLGIKLVSKLVDMASKEHLQPEYLAINPLNKVPAIDDDGFILWESRAIMTYLVNKYAPDSPLYPKDPKARAVVDKMLQFDLSAIFKGLVACLHPVVFEKRPAPPEEEENLKKALATLEKILEKTPYAAGNHLTLADYSIFSNMTVIEELFEGILDDYPKISAWSQRLKKESPKYKEIHEVPLQMLKEFMKSKK